MSMLDLHWAIKALDKDSVLDRARQLAERYEGARLIAVGGIPVENDAMGDPHWMWRKRIVDLVTPFNNGLALSAELTYMNKSQLTASELALRCVQRNHDWAANWMTLSVLFCGFGQQAELAFSRDKRFWMSWPVCEAPGIVFAAHGSVKDWRRFAAKGNNASFHADARRAMSAAYTLLEPILL